MAADGEAWRSYIAFSVDSSKFYSKIRIYAWYDSEYCNKIDIDAYYGTSWHDVYEGGFADRQYSEFGLGGTYNVQYVRVRFYIKGSWNYGNGIKGDLHDVQLWMP